MKYQQGNHRCQMEEKSISELIVSVVVYPFNIVNEYKRNSSLFILSESTISIPKHPRIWKAYFLTQKSNCLIYWIWLWYRIKGSITKLSRIKDLNINLRLYLLYLWLGMILVRFFLVLLGFSLNRELNQTN